MVFLVWFETASAFAQAPSNAPAPAAVIVELRGPGVEISRQPAVWDPAHTNQALYPGNLLRTDEHSQALVRFSDLETVRVAERSTLRIGQPAGQKRSFEFLKGLLYFFHRDKPNQFEITTPQMSAIIRGTEFTLEVAEDGTSTLSLLEGQVSMANPLGQIELTTGDQAVAAPGQPPRKTALLEAANVIQWCLYYPAVLDLEELGLSEVERAALNASLAAYRQGDLVTAFAAYPRQRQPASDAERIYLAALRLSFGQVREAEEWLAATSPQASSATLTGALRRLVAAVQGAPESPNVAPLPAGVQSASLFLADSYVQQSQARLAQALWAARKAAELSPDFAFAWARVAELEFSFGRAPAAGEAIEKSLRFAPRNPQAQALRGFELAARNRIRDALAAFNKAISLDPTLANGWLGRGLCRIKQGEAQGGRQDLQIAALVEPNRALLRSYLGKAFSNAGDDPRAARELELAKTLDPRDPTAWLYSALLLQQENQINQAIGDLERSEELNDNRRIYRSRLLLDEDRAVRSANLASIYRDAGMTDVSLREAARAVTYDYANYSAHLFLANSFDALRDPTRFNLRYETAWFNELLLANLLAPVGAGTFSQNPSQQEYTRLFDVKKLGLATTTGARSDGQYRELVSQFGNFGDLSYSLDLDYQHNDTIGERGRPNNGLDRIEWYSQFKFQVTAADSLFLLIKYQDYHSGDNFQYYDPSAVYTDPTHVYFGLSNAPVVRTNFTFDEFQTPIVVGGYHHEWSPGVHTLLLGGRLENDQRFSDSVVLEDVIYKSTNGVAQGVTSFPFDITYRSRFEAYTAELEQIFHSERQTLQIGGRFQDGKFENSNELVVPAAPQFTPYTNGNPPLLSSPAASTNTTDPFRRGTIYAYYTLQPVRNLFLTAGVSYDHVEYPQSFRNPPVGSGQASSDLVGPKAAMVYAPAEWITLRGAYTRSLGGVTLDQSFRLEPTSLAGFIQSFRSIMPESVVGSVSAPTFETYGAAVDLKFKSRTYVGLQYLQLVSDVDQQIGVFDYVLGGPPSPAVPSSTPEHLGFREHIPSLTINQLVGDLWSCGVSYKFTRSELNQHLLAVPTLVFNDADNTARSALHQAGAFVQFDHSSGFFARAEANWYHQDNVNHTHIQTGPASVAPVEMGLPGDEFTQVNLFAGWRFRRRLGDVTFGVLNLGGGDYHLNPLNSYPELPRERVYTAQLRLRF